MELALRHETSIGNPAASRIPIYLYRLPLDGHETPAKITISPGADDSPLYSPDGKFLAFRSAASRRLRKRPRWRIMVLET